MLKYFLSVAFFLACNLSAEEKLPFPSTSPDGIIRSLAAPNEAMRNISEIIKNDLLSHIEEKESRESYFNTALHLISISNRQAEVNSAPVQKVGKFLFIDQKNGSWQIASEILQTLADYSLKDGTLVDIEEKPRYLMAYVAHCYGRTISANLPIRGADLAVLKELEIYYNNQAMAQTKDILVYSWYVYFLACVERKALGEAELARIDSIISDPIANEKMNPRAYQMLCMARMKGDSSLDYEGRKSIFTQKLFKSLMQYGAYQTAEGFYSPYVDVNLINGIMDSTRKGYGIEQSVEELKKNWLKQ